VILAVASGKGGTGKTTVAAHLALASAQVRKTLLVDLDVEAPDARAYFPDARPKAVPFSVNVLVPRLSGKACTGCGLCAKACRFGAILALGGVITIDQRICKGCGRCIATCPSSALVEVEVPVGAVSHHEEGKLEILEGRMTVGDIRSTAVIEAAKRLAAGVPSALQIRDCPPGVACPATHAVEGADYVILVAEPTEFSLHDLGSAINLVKESGSPLGLVINKYGFGTADLAQFCEARGVPVIGRLSFLRSRAESGAGARLWKDDPLLMREIEGILDLALGSMAEGTRR
jgi:MinD superfamily P-loop ATPase